MKTQKTVSEKLEAAKKYLGSKLLTYEGIGGSTGKYQRITDIEVEDAISRKAQTIRTIQGFQLHS
jgi:hypothetical protein